jgi:hypothetical protein
MTGHLFFPSLIIPFWSGRFQHPAVYQHYSNICVIRVNQQKHQLFIQFINYVW